MEGEEELRRRRRNCRGEEELRRGRSSCGGGAAEGEGEL